MNVARFVYSTIRFTIALSIGAIASGLLATSAIASIVNGGFETGDFTGWTASGAAGSDSPFVSNFLVNSGTYAAGSQSRLTVDSISQTLVTVPSQMYQVSFWLANFMSSQPPYANAFDAYFDGSLLLHLENQPSILPYTQYSFNVPATTASTVLQFDFRHLNTHDPDFWRLDDVHVEPIISGAVPELSSLCVWGGLVVAALSVYRRRISNLVVCG